MRHTRRTTRFRSRTLAITIAVVTLAALVPVVLSLRNSDHPANTANAVTAPGQLNAAQEAGVAGPVTELDRTFLVKVRQAGLWEIPAGRLAQANGSSEAVKRAGHHLLDGHSRLDQLVREDAEILGVELPDEATEEQQQWVDQLTGLRGEEFDRFFANVLRSSHGKIFATIGEVRAGTQNDLIRRHAREANQTVLDHMEVLEDTGLVTAETLAEVETAVTPPK
ncbi:DUF4142 domain-containing protein [Amycolatopsis albispora]|uniref:DUF4142 domain-containing protein n=1 Tax=Amycolatopsis albispora TaxID=1804986 RepID=A0A344L582_9PSEU|nr:DUF4142 domain-containing protein [Amycolatopsis albispora]AXB43206.1 hypothetical protein A4R43_12130 [Amycolatopsis albispora]